MELTHLLLPTLVALGSTTTFGQAAPHNGSVVKAIVGQVGNVVKPAKVYADAHLGSKAYFAVSAGDRLVVNANAPKGWVKVKVTIGFGYLQAGAVKLGEQVEMPADQVGQIVRDAQVFKKPESGGKSYFSVKANETLVVNADGPDGWTKVALDNGEYGFLENDAVTLVAMAVPKEDQAIKPRVQATMSRGSYSRGSATAGAAAADTGLNYLGTKYVWGGNDMENGIDCSGFVQQLFGKFGVKLPRTAAEQALYGQSIERLEDLRKGDRLYFWETKRNKIGHTGLYLGDGKFVHSSTTHHGVAVDDIREGKWLRILFAARR